MFLVFLPIHPTVQKTINVAVELTLKSKRDLKCLENELPKLFRSTKSQTRIFFDGKTFDQVD